MGECCDSPEAREWISQVLLPEVARQYLAWLYSSQSRTYFHKHGHLPHETDEELKRQLTGLTAAPRDQRIQDLRRLGWTEGRIATAVGMTLGGVREALKRIAADRPGGNPLP
jgi:hypothetical protein